MLREPRAQAREGAFAPKHPTASAVRFRLPADGALHLLRNIDLFDFDLGDLDSPGLRVLVQNHLQFAIYFFSLGEDFVKPISEESTDKER